MVRNTTGGKSAKSAKSSGSSGSSGPGELVFADEGQAYALVTKMLGDRRVMVKMGEVEIMAIIPGKFKSKSFWVTPGCHVLLNLREYQSDKADIAYVYSAAESKRLLKIGEISDGKVEGVEEERQDISFDEL